MSQYGYVPIENVSLLQEQYSVANPSTWQFEKNGQQYGGVEEYPQFSQAQKDELIALDGAWFESAEDFQAWLYSES
jgi:hypothetical protein